MRILSVKKKGQKSQVRPLLLKYLLFLIGVSLKKSYLRISTVRNSGGNNLKTLDGTERTISSILMIR